jgi:hypothetical protein
MKQLENPYTYFAEYTQTIMLLAFILFLVNSALEPFNNSGRSVAQTLDGYVTKATPTLFELVKGKAELRITGYPQALQTRCSSTYTGDKNGSEHIGSKATVDVPNGKNASEETETSHSSAEISADSAPTDRLDSSHANLPWLIDALIDTRKNLKGQAYTDILLTLPAKWGWTAEWVKSQLEHEVAGVLTRNRTALLTSQKLSMGCLKSIVGGKGKIVTPEGEEKLAKRAATHKKKLADFDYDASKVKEVLLSLT